MALEPNAGGTIMDETQAVRRGGFSRKLWPTITQIWIGYVGVFLTGSLVTLILLWEKLAEQSERVNLGDNVPPVIPEPFQLLWAVFGIFVVCPVIVAAGVGIAKVIRGESQESRIAGWYSIPAGFWIGTGMTWAIMIGIAILDMAVDAPMGHIFRASFRVAFAVSIVAIGVLFTLMAVDWLSDAWDCDSEDNADKGTGA